MLDKGTRIMKKYTTKTIIDYINGEDIEDFTLEELEDDMDFMKSVINYTNDKNMVAMCSERIQNDFGFIKFIIYKFSKDISFITSIADKFLDSCDKEHKMDRYELAIIMSSIITDREQSFKYQLIGTVAFQQEIGFVGECKAQYPNEKYGEGFIFISEDDDNSPLMVEYFAKKFIDYILSLYDIDFEKYLHKHFSTKKDLEKEKVNSLLIDFLMSYDIALANYAKVHLSILDSLKDEVKTAIQNWDNFEKKLERELYNLLFEQVYFYRQEHPDCTFPEDDILYSIGLELGIYDKILKYDISKEEEDIPERINVSTLSFQNKIHYYALKKLIESIINGTYVEDDNYIAKKFEGKIITADFTNSQKKGY